MSTDDPLKKGQDFLHIVPKAKEFTEELLKENERLRFKIVALGCSEGAIGASAQTGENFFAPSVARRDPSPFEEPLAVIPLKIKDSVIGVISINKLLFQKTAFTTMDYELFTLLAGHAATAIFSAKLY